jgi:hypothetical protein
LKSQKPASAKQNLQNPKASSRRKASFAGVFGGSLIIYLNPSGLIAFQGATKSEGTT